jgi:hypothetical protein
MPCNTMSCNLGHCRRSSAPVVRSAVLSGWRGCQVAGPAAGCGAPECRRPHPSSIEENPPNDASRLDTVGE